MKIQQKEQLQKKMNSKGTTMDLAEVIAKLFDDYEESARL